MRIQDIKNLGQLAESISRGIMLPDMSRVGERKIDKNHYRISFDLLDSNYKKTDQIVTIDIVLKAPL